MRALSASVCLCAGLSKCPDSSGIRTLLQLYLVVQIQSEDVEFYIERLLEQEQRQKLAKIARGAALPRLVVTLTLPLRFKRCLLEKEELSQSTSNQIAG